jgi:hypothetical protein
MLTWSYLAGYRRVLSLRFSSLPVLAAFQSMLACGILLPMVKDSETAITPLYYNGDDVMQIIERYDLDFCLGNSVKYILRAGHKHDNASEDLKKALWYLERKIQQLKIQQIKAQQEKDID